jgi:hypothetical protein
LRAGKLVRRSPLGRETARASPRIRRPVATRRDRCAMPAMPGGRRRRR